MMIYRLKGQKGNAAFLTLSLALACILVILALFEFCRIFIIRETVKAVSDSIALAAAQELIFLSPNGINLMAGEMALESGCRLTGLRMEYDEVEVTVEKDTHISALGKAGLVMFKTVSSSSRANIIYPWDRRWKQCRYYEFGFRPY
jgi:hypothetical protein